MKDFLVINGGNKLRAKLKEVLQKVNRKSILNVGFLEGSFEGRNNVPTAQVAFWNEFGSNVPAHTVTIYRKIRKNSRTGDFIKKGQFVPIAESNYSSEHEVAAYSTPARPFFRRMIDLGKAHWAEDLARFAQVTKMDMEKSLEMLGTQMEVELQDSIQANVYAPLAKSTIQKKGHDNQLVDSTDMLQSVSHEVLL